MYTTDAVNTATSALGRARRPCARSSCPEAAAHNCPVFDMLFDDVLDRIDDHTQLETRQDGLVAILASVVLINSNDLPGARRRIVPLIPFVAGSEPPNATQGSPSERALDRLLAPRLSCRRATQQQCTLLDVVGSSLLDTLPPEGPAHDGQDAVDKLIAATITYRYGKSVDTLRYLTPVLAYLDRELSASARATTTTVAHPIHEVA